MFVTKTSVFIFAVWLAVSYGVGITAARAPPRELNYPLNCMLRYFNFTGQTTDSRGKKCRGSITTKACFGSCESFEYGTYEFPYIVTVNPTCNYGEKRDVTTMLTDCDPDIHDSARIYTYVEALSCACSECNPAVQNCKHLPTKKRSGQQNGDVTESYPGEFLNFVPTRRSPNTNPKKKTRKAKRKQQQQQQHSDSRSSNTDTNMTW